MAKPAIITVDDDPQVLSAVERDLRRRYAADHRILRAESGADALAALTELKKRGDTVALILADQRMPAMTGTEVLLRAAPPFPRGPPRAAPPLRRPRRGHPGDQRRRARPLPHEAVGPA